MTVQLPSGVRIRRYETRDYDDVWRLHLEGVSATREQYSQATTGHYEDDLRDIEGTYLVEGANFWVVEAPEGLVGMAALQRIDAGTGRLRRMRVTEGSRRQGIAQALVEVLTDFCREQGYGRIILDTLQVQEAAQRLYERNGFVRLGERMLGPFRVIDYEKRLG